MSVRGLFVLCAVATAGTFGAWILLSCQTYEPPPTATLQGLDGGILPSSNAAIVVQFSTPVDPSTVSVEIAPFNIDAYGNLPDERPDGGSLGVLASHAPQGDTHFTSSFSPDNTQLTLQPTPLDYLPIGPSLVFLVLPGLKSTTLGTTLNYRERIPFAYPVECGGVHNTTFQSGAYFFLLDVEKPLGVELKVFASIDVNTSSGVFDGQFTAALRNSDPTRCTPACTDGLVCELIPSEQCVEMSTPPVSVYESTDFLPKATAPNGYTFSMHGCAVDEGDAGVVNIVTAPGVLNVSSPAVSIQGLTFTAQFAPVDGGLVQASGTMQAATTYLGTISAGPGQGSLSALSIPDADVPANLPSPIAPAEAGTFPDGAVIGDAAGGG